MMRILSTGGESIAFEVIGTRAYSAAQTGLQWRLQQIFSIGPVTKHCNGSVVDPAVVVFTSSDTALPPAPFSFLNTNGLHNCEVTALSCNDFKLDGTTYYTVSSTGQCSIGDEVTTRSVEVQARSL